MQDAPAIEKKTSPIQPLVDMALIAVFVFLVYTPVILDRGFFSETSAVFYGCNAKRSLVDVLREYITFDAGWYRPTVLNGIPWLVSCVVGWHRIGCCKLISILTLVVTCWMLYLLLSRVWSAGRIAGLFACVYFAAHPSLYRAVYEFHGWDFLYILATIATVILFLLRHQPSVRSWPFVTMAAVGYLVALTCKEIACTIPLYLAVLSLLYVAWNGTDVPIRDRVRRELLYLAPFFAILFAYYILHIRQIPARPQESDYRTSLNLHFLVENCGKYPLWMARVFGWTGDSHFQLHMHDTFLNNTIGLAAAILTAALWCDGWSRDKKLRSLLPALVAWIGVFLIVPVVSGAYGWHINLALVGYAGLFGVAMQLMWQRWPRAFARGIIVATVFIGSLILGRINLAERLSVQSDYRMNSKVLTAPPVTQAQLYSSPRAMSAKLLVGPASLDQTPLIYIENRHNWILWHYGNEWLFRFVYLDPTIEQVLVPQMDSVPTESRLVWMRRPNAFFFYHDLDGNWTDASEEFWQKSLRAWVTECQKHNGSREAYEFLAQRVKMSPRLKDAFAQSFREVAGQFVEQGSPDKAVEFLRPIVRNYPDIAEGHYMLAFSLFACGKDFAEAVDHYGLALDLKYPEFWVRYNRGHAFLKLGRLREARADFLRAQELSPDYAGTTDSLRMLEQAAASQPGAK